MRRSTGNQVLERSRRRGLEQHEDIHAFGPFRLDLRRRRLSRDGTVLPLTPTVIDVLIHLASNAGRVVTKDELLEAVWPDRVVEEANVKQAVFTLRKALGAEGEGVIATVPGRGYRFTASLDPAPDPLPAAKPTPSAARAPAARSAMTTWRIGALLALAAAGFCAAVLWSGRARPVPGAGRTVVLADFDNLTGDAVFDRTLTDLLRVDLSQSPYVNVVSEKQAQETLKLMTKSADLPLTAVIAEEICQRNNGDAVVRGEIAALGARYLITLTATDCSGAQSIAAVKAEVTGREGVAPAIDRLIAAVRSKLGESPRSIARFNVPLVSEQTASLDALKAYSEAKWLFDHGELAEAIPLDRHAVALDPRFSAAYANLGVIYVALYDDHRSVENFAKAYALRDTLNEREKLRITALYAQFASKDYNQAIANYRLWTEIYPQDAVAWSNLANAEDYIGEHFQAVADGKRALALRPRLENPFVVLARAELAAGDADSALAVARQAVDQGLAGDPTHRELLRIADARGDVAGVARETAWGAATATALRTQEVAGEIALAQGRVGPATVIFDRVSQALEARGTYDYMRPATARMLTDMGLSDRAAGLLRVSSAGQAYDPDYLYTLAAVGDAEGARRLLAAWRRANPTDTLAAAVYAPEAEAALALRRGDGAAAIAALGPAQPFMSRAPDVAYLLGQAWLAVGDGPRAASAFRTILTHRGWSPESPLIPLAQLGLARALRITGDRARSLEAYRRFFDLWRNAEADLPPLTQARREYRRVTVESVGGGDRTSKAVQPPTTPIQR